MCNPVSVPVYGRRESETETGSSRQRAKGTLKERERNVRGTRESERLIASDAGVRRVRVCVPKRTHVRAPSLDARDAVRVHFVSRGGGLNRWTGGRNDGQAGRQAGGVLRAPAGGGPGPAVRGAALRRPGAGPAGIWGGGDAN